ncbi:MAG: GTP 3',8-cyclase MoaA [Phycisphaerales bacterium]|nr:GTP 3',8-cyclase MoaA [Phycisphaerales bacterium]
MTLPLSVLQTSSNTANAPRGALRPNHLIDAHGRMIQDLRLSVTDRCNFRCTYCMEPDTRFMPKRNLLNLQEYLRLARVVRGLGITKIRLTGGEPTLYPDLDQLIDGLGKLALDDLAMTTNGWQLEQDRALRWKQSGLTRLTFSLDTLREERMSAITRSVTSVAQVVSSIETAHRAKLTPLKVNAVIMRGVNDDEITEFAHFASEMNIAMRLIEFMPLDAGRSWDRKQVVPMSEMLERLQEVHELVPHTNDTPHSTSTNFSFANGRPGSIGIIAPVSRPFCGACNRLRITADGKMRPCLFSLEEWDLSPLLRQGATDDALASYMADGVWQKQKGHGIDSEQFEQPARTMSSIGG